MQTLEFETVEKNGIINIPKQLINKVKNHHLKIVMMFQDFDKNNNKTKTLAGSLNEYANPKLIPLEKNAFSDAMVNKMQIVDAILCSYNLVDNNLIHSFDKKINTIINNGE